MKAKLIAWILCVSVIIGCCPTQALAAARMPFTDVPYSAWYCPEISYAYASGLTNGTTQTTFSPADNITRGQFVTLLVRYLQKIEPEEAAVHTASPDPADETTEPTSETSPVEPDHAGFIDVPEDAYYAAHVHWAFTHRLVNGVSSDSFAPDDFITREDIATILYRTQLLDWFPEIPTTTASVRFTDEASISDYATEAVSVLQQQQIVKGDEDRFLPLNHATRAEAAAMIVRMVLRSIGHIHDYRLTDIKASTCVSQGYQCFECACGSFYHTPEAYKPHTWATESINTAQILTCSVCGAKQYHYATIYAPDVMIQTKDIQTQINKFARLYPDLIKTGSAGQSVNGADIPVVFFGKGSRYILMNGNLHGREYIGPNYLLEVIDEYAFAYETNGRIRGHEVRPLLDRFTLIIVPCLNPDGRDIAIAGNTFYKSNGRKVDLNANFPVPGASYSGASAGSEPETQAIIGLLNKYPVETLLDCHTSGEVIYYSDTACTSSFTARSKALASVLAADSGYAQYTYAATAGCANYARRPYGVPGLTIEMLPYSEAAIDCSVFNRDIWSKLDSMPALTMEFLLNN